MRVQSSKMLMAAMLLGGFLLGAMLCGTLMCDTPSSAVVYSDSVRKSYAPVPKREAVSDRREAMAMLQEWFYSNGGKLHDKVVLREREDLPGVWGFFATGDVKDGEVFIAVPQQLFLNSHTCLHAIIEYMTALREKSSLPPHTVTPRLIMEVMGFAGEHDAITPSKEAEVAGNAAMQVAVLALFLTINWDNPDHFFYPYFATLPKGCQMSVCWSKDKLEEAFIPSQVESILEDQRTYTSVAQRLGLNTTDFLEKVSLVSSRYWGDPSMEDVATLVPVADMVNHAAAKEGDALNTFSTRSLKGSYLLQEGEDKHAGDEMHASYGQKHNGKLLRDYGFTMKNNPVDTCEGLQSILTSSYINNVLKFPCPAA
eukprot:g3616.t1